VEGLQNLKVPGEDLKPLSGQKDEHDLLFHITRDEEEDTTAPSPRCVNSLLSLKELDDKLKECDRNNKDPSIVPIVESIVDGKNDDRSALDTFIRKRTDARKYYEGVCTGDLIRAIKISKEKLKTHKISIPEKLSNSGRTALAMGKKLRLIRAIMEKEKISISNQEEDTNSLENLLKNYEDQSPMTLQTVQSLNSQNLTKEDELRFYKGVSREKLIHAWKYLEEKIRPHHDDSSDLSPIDGE